MYVSAYGSIHACVCYRPEVSLGCYSLGAVHHFFWAIIGQKLEIYLSFHAREPPGLNHLRLSMAGIVNILCSAWLFGVGFGNSTCFLMFTRPAPY